MAHSKLPWKKKHHKILDFHGRLIADVRGACGFQEDEDNAKFIREACNAHAKLEEKAELLDRLSRLQNSTEFGSEIELAALMAAIKDLSL